MADTILQVGSGKTYDTADGFKNALAALPADMNSVSGDVIIEMFPDYEYNLPSTNFTYNPSNPSASKKVIIRPASGYEHKGVFGVGVVLLWNSASSNGYIIIYYPYFECRDVTFKYGINCTSIVGFLFYGSNCNVRNCLTEHYAGYTYPCNYQGSAGGIFTNNILWSSVGATYIFEGPTTGTVLVANNLAYGAIFDFNNNANITAINNGVIKLGSFSEYQRVTGVVGYGNYRSSDAGTTNFGSNFLSNSTASFKFRNLAGKDLRLQLGSPLINTGSENSPTNPLSISGESWNANHRSPYNNVVIQNIFMSHPQEMENVQGGWANGMVLNFLSPGRQVFIGGRKGTYYGKLSNSNIGPVTQGLQSNVYNTSKRVTGKKVTISTIFKGPSTGVYYILGNTSNGLYLPAVNQVGFFSNIGTTFTALVTINTFIDVNDFYTLTLSIDLEKSTNAEKIKLYLYQKGFMHKPTLTFSGTAPTTLDLNTVKAEHQDSQGVTSMWNRSLTYEEIYNIAYDPYALYRDNKKLLLLTGVIKKASGVWFLRKFIMGQ